MGSRKIDYTGPVQQGGQGGRPPPQFFKNFTYFPWNFTPQTLKVGSFLMFRPPSFCVAPPVLEKLYRAWYLFMEGHRREVWNSFVGLDIYFKILMSRPSISGYTFLKIGIQSLKLTRLQKVHKNKNLKKKMLSVQKFMDFLTFERWLCRI